jgi:hypothetical protein
MSVVVEVVEQLPPDASGKRPIVVPWSPAGAADV